MEEEKKEEKPKENYLDIYPIKKGKRVLAYLADFFICFILSAFLYTAGIFPLGKLIVNYDQTASEAEEDLGKERILLYSSNLLFMKGSQEDFSADLQNTETKYVSYLLKQDDLALNPFYTFYVGVCMQDADYINEKIIGVADIKGFFSSEKDANGLRKLKDAYMADFKPVLDEKDSLSDAAQAEYDSFTNNFFLKSYSLLVNDLRTSSLVPSASSLAACKSLYASYLAKENKLNLTVSYAAYITFFLSVFICFGLIPLVSKRGKTLGFMIMKLNRVGKDNLAKVSKPERIMQMLYAFIFCLPFLLFLPFAYISFSYLFNLPLLDWPSYLGLGYALISFLFLLFSPFNQTLTDFLCKSLIIDEDSLDAIERTRNKQYGC